MARTTIAPEERAGWRVRQWCEAVGIAKSTYYALPPHLAPESVTVGRSRIIKERPADWLCRVGRGVPV